MLSKHARSMKFYWYAYMHMGTTQVVGGAHMRGGYTIIILIHGWLESNHHQHTTCGLYDCGHVGRVIEPPAPNIMHAGILLLPLG